ncbi:MAG TPA: hypothetical protein VM432_07370 [Bdellovibrionales bacterium]|jgi:hypothetical protein|nr:hypothetical protein [Bdellovibrionales bacterium]
MRSILAAVFVAVVIFASGSSFAGVSVGNGGSAVVCRKSDGTETVRLLDFFEAERTGRHWQIGRMDEGDSVEEKLSILLISLQRHSPLRAVNYRSAIDHLKDIFVFGEIPAIDDTGPLHAAIPDGCSLKQVAFQVPEDLRPTGKRIQIDQNLYEKMSLNDQAGLLLHELIYAELAQWGTRDSSQLRPFVAYIASTDFATSSTEVFLENLRNAGFVTYEVHSAVLSFLNENGEPVLPKFCLNGEVETGWAAYGSQLKTRIGTYRVKGRVVFYPSGDVAELTLAADGIAMLNESSQSGILLKAGTRLRFDIKGKLFDMTPPRLHSVSINQTSVER